MSYDDLIKEFLTNMRALRAVSRKGDVQENIQGEAFVLHFIRERSGKVIPSDISNALGVSSARIAAALNSLEEKGFITRTIDSEDRRRIIVEITPKGSEYAYEQQKKVKERMKGLLILLGEEDSKELVRITGRLVEILSKNPMDCNRP